MADQTYAYGYGFTRRTMTVVDPEAAYLPDWLKVEIRRLDAELWSFEDGIGGGLWPVLPAIQSGWVLVLRWPRSAKDLPSHEGLRLAQGGASFETALEGLRKIMPEADAISPGRGS